MGPGQSILITGASSGIGREAAMRLVRAGHLVLAGGRRPDALAGLARAAGGRLADADLRRLFDTNVFGLLAVTRAFVPAMRQRGAGRVVNVGSIMGRVAMSLLGAYNASKHAVAAATDALRMELPRSGSPWSWSNRARSGPPSPPGPWPASPPTASPARRMRPPWPAPTPPGPASTASPPARPPPAAPGAKR